MDKGEILPPHRKILPAEQLLRKEEAALYGLEAKSQTDTSLKHLIVNVIWYGQNLYCESFACNVSFINGLCPQEIP